MADHHHKQNAGHDGYEVTDAQPRPLVIFTIVMVIASIVTFLLMAIMFKMMDHYEVSQDKPSGFVRDSRWKAPTIELETNPSRLREQLNKEEQEQLTTYAWIDPTGGKVRIPLERALQITAAKGLPYRESLSADQEGSAALTESGGQKAVSY